MAGSRGRGGCCSGGGGRLGVFVVEFAEYFCTRGDTCGGADQSVANVANVTNRKQWSGFNARICSHMPQFCIHMTYVSKHFELYKAFIYLHVC